MNKKELAKRYILFVVSLFFAALGVAVTKWGGAGHLTYLLGGKRYGRPV